MTYTLKNIWLAQVVLGCSILARAQPTVSTTLYPVGGLNLYSSITSGPGGTLWFTSVSNNTVGQITTAGAISQYSVPANLTLSGIATGPDGAIWLAIGADGVGRITTSGTFTEYLDKSTFGSTNSITAGPDGALWFTDNLVDLIGRVTTTGTFTAYPLPATLHDPGDITTGPDGALWFLAAGSEIGRITTAGAVTFWTIPTLGAGATSITAGPDGAMWFAQNGPGGVGRITTSGGSFTLYPTKGEYPAGITTGPDGALWFTTNDGDAPVLGRITTAGDVTYYSLASSNWSYRVTEGPDGALWLIDYNVNSIARAVLGGFIAEVPAVSSDGVVSASDYGKFPATSPGSQIEIYGSNLASDTRGWGGADFNSVNAPTSLDGTWVTIGGQAAFVDYISPGQVNVVVPSDVPTGLQPVTVKTVLGTSAAYNVTVNAVEPGLLAPSSFNLSGTQYVVAFLPDGAYALPAGAMPGVNSRPARPGDIITLYGIGFGQVTPDIPAGQLVKQSNTLASSFQVLVGGTLADVQYAGLAPNYTGLYQFDITVPNLAAGDAVPLTFSVGGVSGTQTLNIAVQN